MSCKLQYCKVRCSIVQRGTVQYNIVLYCIIQEIVLYWTLQYRRSCCTVPSSTARPPVVYNAIQYNIVLYSNTTTTTRWLPSILPGEFFEIYIYIFFKYFNYFITNPWPRYHRQVQYSVLQCNVCHVNYNTARYGAVLYSAVLYNTILYCIV